jgi:hypothetical protein
VRVTNGSQDETYAWQKLLVSHYVQLTILTHVLYRVIQEECSILQEVMITVIVSKKVYMKMCPILNGYGDIAI